ncbi:MAG: heme-copper oxidase subunit III [Phycisphaerae bacterium]|nr:heme-copper oxidase subunit III [Phycisphaerae bacterium]
MRGGGARGSGSSGAGVREPSFEPSRGGAGMACLIFTESCFFAAFIVAYLFYAGRDKSGPTPWQVLELGPVIVNSVALLSSSVTVVFAMRMLARGSIGAFRGWMLLTILLGAYFLYGTGVEWTKLIRDDDLTIATNLFGTTFYSLVGFHAFHVTVGLLLLSLVLVLSLLGKVESARDHRRVDLLSWYWHFVDAVWVFVFLTVYVIGRQPPGGAA